MADTTRCGRVVGLASLSERVTEVTLRIEDDGPFRWLAGQHVTVRPDLPGGEASSFSIAAAPTHAGEKLLTLAVSNGSEFLAHARVGSAIAVEGPFGELTWHDAPAALLIGAGTGVAPLRAIVHAALVTEGAAPIVLVAGNRSVADLLWHSEFVALADERSRFRYEPVVSQPDAHFAGRRGHVQAHLAPIVTTLPRGLRAYLCGSTRMVEDSRLRLERLGVPPELILSEADA